MKKFVSMLFVIVLGSQLASPAPASSASGEADESRQSDRCARRFTETVRERDDAFAARDLTRLMTFYRDDAVEIDPSGAYHQDKSAITAHLANLFQLQFSSTFVEMKKIADCDTALLVLDSRFDAPQIGLRQHFLTAQTFTYDRGRWRLLLASNTMLAS